MARSGKNVDENVKDERSSFILTFATVAIWQKIPLEWTECHKFANTYTTSRLTWTILNLRSIKTRGLWAMKRESFVDNR